MAGVGLAVAPAIVSGSRRGELLNCGAVALVMLLWLVPVWVLPWAIFGATTVTLVGDVLTAQTLRGTRTVVLSRVDWIWARRVPARTGMLVLAGLAGENQRPVWFLWGSPGTVAYGEAMTDLCRQIAQSSSVHVSERAAIILGLDGHTDGLPRLVLWLRGLLLFGAIVAVLLAVLLAYVLAFW
ncbi:MAG: hypothetical protein ACXVXP_01045 [Mycobacteriaceae bacterium]